MKIEVTLGPDFAQDEKLSVDPPDMCDSWSDYEGGQLAEQEVRADNATVRMRWPWLPRTAAGQPMGQHLSQQGGSTQAKNRI